MLLLPYLLRLAAPGTVDWFKHRCCCLCHCLLMLSLMLIAAPVTVYWFGHCCCCLCHCLLMPNCCCCAACCLCHSTDTPLLLPPQPLLTALVNAV
jgi:hypothetical protein